MFPETIPNQLFLLVLGEKKKKKRKAFAFHHLLQLLLHLQFPNLSLEYALYSNLDIILVAAGNLTVQVLLT